MTGSASPGKRSQGATRPIQTRRDYELALSVSQRLLAQPKRDTDAELRLQALLKEMDRFEAFDKLVHEEIITRRKVWKAAGVKVE